jgi:hypothetical protein
MKRSRLRKPEPPAPGAQQRLRGARPTVAERGARAKRRRRVGEKGLWNSYPPATGAARAAGGGAARGGAETPGIL